MLWARDADGPAAWLRLPDAVIGLAPPGAPLGPNWVRRREPWPVLAEGDPIVVDADGLRTGDGRLVLDRRHALGWAGPLPEATTLAAAGTRALVTDALAPQRRSVLLDPPWRDTAGPAVALLGRVAPLDGLKVAAEALGGLGPGLTPAGDDALSGILFAERAMGGPSVEPALLAVAGSVRTSDLGASVLDASARGFHIEPVHDLVMAAVTGDGRAATAAARALDRYGSSSGADIAYGIGAAFTRR